MSLLKTFDCIIINFKALVKWIIKKVKAVPLKAMLHFHDPSIGICALF